ncbi:MAG: hypothetical protein K9N46_08600 [Candidatus Marinimicrobia bacterium]|nr:hypothetical protein [Candidatus Neomarinimicrobiota bacterium]MCF7880784.1 hypothetical protein [Candidatus Neomarinimicrobiota bacterium]
MQRWVFKLSSRPIPANAGRVERSRKGTFKDILARSFPVGIPLGRLRPAAAGLRSG